MTIPTRHPSTFLTALCVAAALADPASACTNFLISSGATVDGSTMITYAADAHTLFGDLTFEPARNHPAGAKLDIFEWDTGKHLGQIDQVEHTHRVVGNINEHQLAIGETTFTGREELIDPEGGVDYGSLMYIALQRAKTAREAIEVITQLVAEYGYYSSGESFSLSDPEEVWILEMIGKGPGNRGAVWVARRVPDGYIAGHANAARIGKFPLKDPKNTLYAPDVISFARESGFYEGSDEDFSFADAYDPDTYGGRRFCDARVWCMYERAAPSQEIGADWAKGVEGAQPPPLWIKPDKKLDVADVMGFMRDHFEGTDFDMTDDIGAGPHQLPYRWRPLTWTVDGQKHLNERAVSTQQTGFSFVSQSRAWLPDPVGGVLWFGVDDTYSTVYFPVYAGVTDVAHSYARGTGSFDEVNFDAAFWVFNQVSNFAYLRYADMIVDIQGVQADLEGSFLAEQAGVDAAAVALYEESPRLAQDYLTAYSQDAGDGVVARWRELSSFLLYKYLDGNVKDEHGHVTHPGYPEAWYQTVATATGEHLQMIKLPGEKAAAEESKRQTRMIGTAVLTLLAQREIALDAKAKARIEGSDDRSELSAWLVQAATALTADDVFRPQAPGH
jgi:dipeptidase